MEKCITHSLWFDSQAEEAAKFYTSVFPHTSMGAITRYGKEGYHEHGKPEGSIMTVTFKLSNLEFTAINGGPIFTFNPSLSFFVVLETEAETNTLWQHLSQGGKVLMPLEKYEWSQRYGWVQDRYGLSWQIALGNIREVGQQITPSFLFTAEQQGRAEEAINFYTTIFKPASIAGILKYAPGEHGPEGTVKHAQFSLAGQQFMAMDNPMKEEYTFNEAVSMIISCGSQEEVDFYWNKLTQGGQEGPCGWLKDKFGVSWQVVPIRLQEMLKHHDKQKTERVTKAFMQMKKFNVAKLEEAFAQ